MSITDTVAYSILFGPIFISILDLAENLLTVFYVDTKVFPVWQEYLAFAIIDAGKVALKYAFGRHEILGSVCRMAIEAGQMILYMFFSEFRLVPVVFYTVACAYQWFPEIIKMIKLTTTKRSPKDEEIDQLAMFDNILPIFTYIKICSEFSVVAYILVFPIILGLTDRFYSPFQQSWYQGIMVAYIWWIANLFNSDILRDVRSVDGGKETKDCIGFLLLATYFMATLVESIRYIQKGFIDEYDHRVASLAIVTSVIVLIGLGIYFFSTIKTSMKTSGALLFGFTTSSQDVVLSKDSANSNRKSTMDTELAV